MSNLYVRVMTGFYSHRKTASLRSTLGTDAFWIPPRLWAYAAENQPDGDLSSYTSEQLAILLGCDKHASSMLQALKVAGFVDECGKIHDWDEHNGYHKKYSERAKLAAEARWKKKEAKKKSIGNRKEESGDKHCFKHACSMVGEMGLICLENEAFLQTWVTWLEHLRQKKKPPTPHAMRLQLKKLAAMGSEKAIATINRCIEKNWQGIYEQEQNAPQSHTSVWSITKAIEAKQELVNALKARHAVETGLDTTWNNEAKRVEFYALRKEIKELKTKLAGMA